ncbi:MAG: hypothetical protein Q9164_006351 [Protoblastenia rupestris]
MSVDTRCADPAILLDVNKAILDFLTWAATKALLWDFQPLTVRSKRGGSDTHDTADIPLRLVESFLIIFKRTHKMLPQDRDLQFRMRLLRYSALFTLRKRLSQPSNFPYDMHDLRHRQRDPINDLRCNEREGSSTNPLNPARLHAPFEEVHMKQEIEASNVTCANAPSQPNVRLPSISLLNTLSSFIALSAVQIALQEEFIITERWMRLAAGYMAQAVAEQYLLYNSQNPNVVQAAFAWGFDEKNTAEEGTDDYLINAMFWDENTEGVYERWMRIRDEHIRAVGFEQSPRLFFSS